LLSTLLSLAYAGRVVERLFLAPSARSSGGATADGGREHPSRTRTVALVCLAAAAVVVLGLGLGSSALAAWFAPVVEGWL
jgi:multicomponent Na+:H+ antiporter subunit D